MKQIEIQLTQEDIERGERLLQAERKKCELAIEHAKSEIEALKPSGLFKSKSNKDEIRQAEDKLRDLENRYIDLTSMNGADFALELKSKDKSKKTMNISSDVLHTMGSVMEKVGNALPIPGAGVGGKVIGGLLKNIGKKK